MPKTMDEQCTSFCGLWCLDCIPSRERLFEVARELAGILDDLQFEKYAELKAQNNDVFHQYAVFRRVLAQIAELECPGPCPEGGGKPDCEVRSCAVSKGYAGCWECDERGDCELLAPLKRVHPNLAHHLKLIREHGHADWAAHRKSHYRWQ